MSEITRLLQSVARGQPGSEDQLIPLVYEELRDLARRRLAREKAGHTLQTTALVNEAYLRLFAGPGEPQWDSRGHFFAAAAEAMRRILVESARRKARLKRGGGAAREDLDPDAIASPEPVEDLLAVDEALVKFASVDPAAARLVKLRYFVGLTVPEAAEVMGMSPRSAERLWAYARAWLHDAIGQP